MQSDGKSMFSAEYGGAIVIQGLGALPVPAQKQGTVEKGVRNYRLVICIYD
jgi:hypothetical protein